MLWECISTIEAQEIIASLAAFDWPNLDRNNREKLHKKLYKIAYPDTFKDDARQPQAMDLAKALRG